MKTQATHEEAPAASSTPDSGQRLTTPTNGKAASAGAARGSFGTRTKTATLPEEAELIPAELREIPRWVCWDFCEKPGETKLRKVPITAGRNTGCNYNTPAQWRTFDDVWSEATRRGGLGIGFVFSSGDDIVGVDLDACYDESGGLKDWARSISREFAGAYCELTPSGQGLHFIGRADGIKGKKRAELPEGAGVERYSENRWFTFTAKPQCEGEVIDLREPMAWLERTFFPPAPSKASAPTTTSKPATYDDDPQLDAELARVCLERMSASRSHGTEDWLRVGMACKATSESLGDDWLRWSAQWSDYEEAECRDRWSRFSPQNIGIGTLVHYATSDASVSSLELRNEARERLGMGPVKAKPASPAKKASERISALPNGIASNGPANLRDDSTLTDVGLARRLVHEANGTLRYCRETRSWMAWTGKVWQADDGLAAASVAKRVSDRLWREFSDLPARTREDSALLRFVQSSASSRAIDAAVKLARSEPGIVVSVRELDADPYLLNIGNGILNLRTLKLQPHSAEALLTHMAGVEFSEEASCPTWVRFVNEVTNGSEELAAFLRRSCGLALTGDVSEQCLWLHYGEGSNGKSTLLNVMAELLGTYAGPAPMELLLVKNNRSREVETQFASLAGKRLVTTVEADSGVRFSEATTKLLTGGDTVLARRLYGEAWPLKPTWHLHIAANHKPLVRGSDDGIWRRIHLVPWQVRFDGKRADRKLMDKLRAELPGILSWCLAGLSEWQAISLAAPECVRAATGEYRGENDVLGTWMAECCVVQETAKCEAGRLYASFKEWAKDRGEDAGNATGFGLQLERLGYRKERPSNGEFRFKTIRHGIGLRDRREED